MSRRSHVMLLVTQAVFLAEEKKGSGCASVDR